MGIEAPNSGKAIRNLKKVLKTFVKDHPQFEVIEKSEKITLKSVMWPFSANKKNTLNEKVFLPTKTDTGGINFVGASYGPSINAEENLKFSLQMLGESTDSQIDEGVITKLSTNQDASAHVEASEV